ncbi:MAG: hypothetical protein J07HX5_01665 [halophilic archaeon J07HX5]|jgi:hypothetical protein|nr:MAG: hypothetical protein J07HX5_01665 [halophilic archaeon J07HX5]
MSARTDPQDGARALFANPRLRAGLAVSNAALIIAIAFFFIDDTLTQLIMYAVAVIDAPVTIWVLGRVAETNG